MKKAYLIGAGQLGSRHLQALRSVTEPLDITVVDPSEESRNVAHERWEAVEAAADHVINFEPTLTDGLPNGDLAIIATNSDRRMEALQKLLELCPTKNVILEKLLFNAPDDYQKALILLQEHDAHAWVNCSMRTMPFYRNLRTTMAGNGPVRYQVSGSQFGLVTNAIHYIDHLAFYGGELEYELDATRLDPNPIESKRKGFLELTGTLSVYFKDGSTGIFTCHADGDMPVVVCIENKTTRCVSRESEGKAWVASSQKSWAWEEVNARIPYQSEMTKVVTESILNAGTCDLTPLEQSVRLHEPLLNGLMGFLKRQGIEQQNYPFT